MFSEDERWVLAQRIVSSRPFARAPQLREFLLFVISRALAARECEINELEIGRTVLGRRAAFNPQEDNIVRVQARHLRTKLDEYFQTEGRDEPLVVTIPKGTYVPSFKTRPSLPITPLSELPQAQPSSWFTGRKQLLGLVLFATLMGLAATIWKITVDRSDSLRNAEPLPRNPLLSRVLRTGDSITVVVGDIGLTLLEHSLARILSLDEYLRDDYPQYLLSSISNKDLRATLASASGRPYTSYSDVNAVTMLMQFGQKYQPKFFIRHPRQLNIRDFETSSFILLGGPISNPWYQLLERRLNFIFEADIKGGKVWIRNKAPKTGEEHTYLPVARPNAEETFAVIGLLPNLSRSGHILLLAGIRMEGVEAATNMILRDELPAGLLSIVRQARGQDDLIEILLSTRTVAGLPQDTKVVAYRVHADETRP